MIKDNPKPTSDIIFRKLFGTDENKDLLVELINAVLLEPAREGTNVPVPRRIVDVVIKNPFQMADYDGAKESILDIKAVDQAGQWYDVEMQMLGHVFYGKRAIYYVAKTYVDQMEAGAPFGHLNPTIGIHFLGYNMFRDERVIRQFTFADVETGDRPAQLSDLRLYFVELEKFHKDWAALATALDLWMAFLIHGEHLHESTLPPVMQSSPGVVKAVSELERFGSDPRTRMLYEGWEKARMASAAEIQYAVEQERSAKAAEIQYAVEQERSAKAAEIQYAVEQERSAKAAEIQYAVEQERSAKAAEIQYAVEQAEERVRMAKAAEIQYAEAQGQSRLLVRLLTRLLGGEPPAAISTSINQLSSTQLTELGEALFDFQSYADVEDWLASR